MEKNISGTNANKISSEKETTRRVLSGISVSVLGPTCLYNIILKDNFLIIAQTAGSIFLSYLFSELIYFKILIKRHKKTSQILGNLNPKEILEYSNKNFQINYSDITKVELKKKYTLKILAAGLTIYTDSKKYNYGLINHEKMRLTEEVYEQYKKILTDVFPDLILL